MCLQSITFYCSLPDTTVFEVGDITAVDIITLKVYPARVNKFFTTMTHAHLHNFCIVRILTVLNIGGVSMGSYSSEMIEACASILAIFGTEIFGLMENTTKP